MGGNDLLRYNRIEETVGLFARQIKERRMGLDRQGGGDDSAASSVKRPQNWTSFKRDTEAGRLLARLYGQEPGSGKPTIRYPKVRRRRSSGREEEGAESPSPPPWKEPGIGSGHGGVGFDRKRAAGVSVPRVGGGGGGNIRGETETIAATSSPSSSLATGRIVPGRRTEEMCNANLRSGEAIRSSYRPPRRREYGTDVEKDRLREVFTHGGGCGLPRELTHPEGPLPSEILGRAKERERIESAKERRRARRNGETEATTSPWPGRDEGDVDRGSESAADADDLFAQIAEEIRERRRFQNTMEEMGGGGVGASSGRKKVSEEISARLDELMRLDRDRALSSSLLSSKLS